MGTGSVGLRDYVVLLEGNGAKDPLFLQIKQEVKSAYASDLPASQYDHQGRRAAEGQKAIQPAHDLLLGWTKFGGHAISGAATSRSQRQHRSEDASGSRAGRISRGGGRAAGARARSHRGHGGNSWLLRRRGKNCKRHSRLRLSLCGSDGSGLRPIQVCDQEEENQDCGTRSRLIHK